MKLLIWLSDMGVYWTYRAVIQNKNVIKTDGSLTSGNSEQIVKTYQNTFTTTTEASFTLSQDHEKEQVTTIPPKILNQEITYLKNASNNHKKLLFVERKILPSVHSVECIKVLNRVQSLLKLESG